MSVNPNNPYGPASEEVVGTDRDSPYGSFAKTFFDVRDGVNSVHNAGGQQLTMDQIHTSADVRWRSMESPEVARSKNEGKINALEVGKEGITMHVFKSGCYEKIVATGEALSPDEVASLTTHLEKHPIGATAWTTIGEEKWSPEGTGGKTPNATYNFERMIKISDNCSLVWKGKHTNPSKPGEAYRVNDTLEIVRS